MVVLTGKNLGERQRDLNNKVTEFIADKKHFDDIKIEENETDVDKLFKIDIASQYKDIDYIIEVLKSGDSLYISRALKCLWLYQDNYSHIVNPEYLHVNIFPYMSIKMKKKMLSAISMHVRNCDCAANYFTYCKNNNMLNVAFKFLRASSDEFKLNVLKNENSHEFRWFIEKQINLQNFIGNSFDFATTCIEKYKRECIDKFGYLYAVNNEKYLDILEKYEIRNQDNYSYIEKLGLRISKDIIIKHKNRVFSNTLYYVNKLNKSMLIKYSSESDAKKYLKNILPQGVKEFWKNDFCKGYDYIINLISINERFPYIKQLFTTSYPEEPFEMAIEFFNLKYYNLLTIDQRELWALRHIADQKEILGRGNDYIWYKFVNIDRTLIDIKNYIMTAPDKNKRSHIVKILVNAARDQKDVKRVLDYYYDRHVNERLEDKENFIDKVLSVHNVFEFDIECWEALDKLLCSVDIYGQRRFPKGPYLAVAVFCHILHNKDMPQALLEFIELDVNYSYFSLLLQKISKEKSEILLQYLINFFVDKLKPFEQDPYNKELREELNKYVNNIFTLLRCFQKEDTECPEIVIKFRKIHSPPPPKPKENKTVNAEEIFRFLKTDVTQAINVLNKFDLKIDEWPHGLACYIFKKLKVYFYNDVAQEYTNYLYSLIKSPDNISVFVTRAAIFGIFQLADESFKITLIEKYVPTQPKVDYSNYCNKLFDIQVAICKFMGYSRPPVPLKNMLQYIKGDYVHYCSPMFNMYLVNFPFPLAMKFTEGILNAPISVQKHGLYLAFKLYSSESLKTLILNTWKKSKNVSIRKIIYQSLFVKLTSSDDAHKDSTILYEALKFFTSDLHQDDHDDLFDLIYCGRLPTTFIADYLQTAWDMAMKLPKKPVNIVRHFKILDRIETNLASFQRDFLQTRIIDEHVDEMLHHKQLHLEELDKEYQRLWRVKWNITAKYITQYSNDEELKQNLALVSHIFNKCLEMWDYRYKDTYTYQKFIFDFLTKIKDVHHDPWNPQWPYYTSVPVFTHIMDILQGAFPLNEIYIIIWDLKLEIYIRLSSRDTITTSHEGGVIQKKMSREQMAVISDNFAKHVKTFVQELLAKNQFYSVFFPEIAKLFICKLERLHHIYNNFNIIFCQSLVNLSFKETHLLALMILPKDAPEDLSEKHLELLMLQSIPADVPKNMKDIHIGILKKIEEFENEEIRSFLHFKFTSTYYKKYKS